MYTIIPIPGDYKTNRMVYDELIKEYPIIKDILNQIGIKNLTAIYDITITENIACICINQIAALSFFHTNSLNTLFDNIVEITISDSRFYLFNLLITLK